MRDPIRIMLLAGLLAAVAGAAHAGSGADSKQSATLRVDTGKVSGDAVVTCGPLRAIFGDGTSGTVALADIKAMAPYPSSLMSSKTYGLKAYAFILYKIALRDGRTAVTARTVDGQSNGEDCAYLAHGETGEPQPLRMFPFGSDASGSAKGWLKGLSQPGADGALDFADESRILPALRACRAQQDSRWGQVSGWKEKAKDDHADCVLRARKACKCDQMASVYCDACMDGRCQTRVAGRRAGEGMEPCDLTASMLGPAAAE